MTGNKYLLDTCIVVEVINGKKEIADKVNELPEFYISSVVLGELYIGINRVKNKEKHLKRLTGFLKNCIVLNTDETSATHYGTCMAHLLKKGKPIPTNDVWIAAVSIQYQLTIITMDKHFKEIEDLDINIW